ncbi:ATP-binding cassette domain-containing protein [Actinopolymorpha rutila]|uniref:ATP-binding cassette subfamily B protein n=1 Tax=Actinopolymorpha rutila TaxID=446787 RepID=A0A852ZCT0_9ACTN|nr:ATP-binding cassette subfamily B protein [Actinopolymorpha rutila]
MGADRTSEDEKTVSLRRRLADDLRLGRLAVGLAWRASPKALVGVAVLLCAQAALTPLQLVLAREVVNAVARHTPAAHLAAAQSEVPLVGWIAAMAATLGLGTLLEPFSRTCQSLVGDRLVGFVTGELVRAANRWQGLARFEDPTFADDLERVSNQAARSGLDLMAYGTRAVLMAVSLMALCVPLIRLSPLVPFLLAAACLPLLARQFDFQTTMGSKLYLLTPQARTLTYSRDVMVGTDGAADVRLFGLGAFFRRRYDDAFASSVAELNRLRWRLTLPMCASAGLAAAAVGGVFGYATWQVATGRGSVGDLVLYGGTSAAVLSTVASLGFHIGFLPMVFAFLPSLDRVLNAPPDLPESPDPLPAPRPIRTGIVFEDVRFGYPGRDEPVLDGLSLHLRPGESCALVGPNGSGKTTLVKLLLRLYDPIAGRVLLDGRDLRDYDLTDLRRELGVLFQDFVRYEFTAGDNIGFGDVASPDRREDRRSHLLAAAERAGAADLLDRLPDGLDTQLGLSFGGRELSGGEWQKLALARAFARDCQVLVLDEPTASLDTRTEYDIFQRFAQLTKGRTAVLVSHRFSTVRMADRIVVLRAGRVAEDGTHEELMAAEGEYARMYRTQAAQYLDDLEDSGGGAADLDIPSGERR